MKKKRFLFFTFILGISFLHPICPVSLQIFPNSYMPIVEIEVEGQRYFLELDSGCSADITLRGEILNKIQNKKQQEAIKTYDFKGVEYKNNVFVIPGLKIGDVEIGQLTAREENSQYFERGCVFYESSNIERRKDPRIAGRIGWGILQRHKWYFDLEHCLLWKIDSADELNQISYFSPYDYIAVPFEMGDTGIVLSVDTNLGVKRFILDTGANFPGLRKSLVDINRSKEVKSGLWLYWTKVLIGGIHFGNYPFYLYEFTSMLDVDGVMSIQFFEKNGVYLDFEKKIAFIGPAKQSFWPRLVDRIKGFVSWLFL